MLRTNFKLGVCLSPESEVPVGMQRSRSEGGIISKLRNCMSRTTTTQDLNSATDLKSHNVNEEGSLHGLDTADFKTHTASGEGSFDDLDSSVDKR